MTCEYCSADLGPEVKVQDFMREQYLNAVKLKRCSICARVHLSYDGRTYLSAEGRL